jgi:S1-C subfamily serine protease
VSRRSPAARAGLHRGDVITHLDTTKITSEEGLLKALAKKTPEETVKLTVVRESGATSELTVRLAAKRIY